jgi:hypothetical protein
MTDRTIETIFYDSWGIHLEMSNRITEVHHEIGTLPLRGVPDGFSSGEGQKSRIRPSPPDSSFLDDFLESSLPIRSYE